MQNLSGAAPEPLLACILVNWNSWQDTAACLASLALQDYPALRVIVVDNGSTDDSLAHLRAAHPWAIYFENGYNAGFSKACNAGARHPLAAAAEFFWFLNNDTTAPPSTARQLVEQALANRNAGVVGAVLFCAQEPTRIQAWGGGVVSLWSAYNRHYTAPIALGPRSYITFASALVRRETFDQLNGLFEGFFMYFEDADFCLRAHHAGWQLAVAPDTAILHKEGGSSKIRGPQRNPRLETIVTISGLTFLRRHAPIPALACALFITSRLAKRILLRDVPSLHAVLRGIRDWRNHRLAPTPNES